MKLWKLFVLALAVCLVGTCLLACGDVAESTPADSSSEETPAPETTVPETTEPETVAPETTEPETVAPETTEPETVAPETTEPETTAPETEPACTHPNLTEKVLKYANCYSGGKVALSCADCGYSEEVTTAKEHDEEKVYSATSGITEYVCSRCGDRSMILAAGKRMKLAAFCDGDATFGVEAPSANDQIELILDGVSKGDISLDAKGEGSVSLENLERGGYSIVFVNKGKNDVRISTQKLDGYFSRPGAVYVEVLGKGSQAYSSFRVYVQTGDPSEEYYVCYKFDYRLNKDVNNFAGNSCTNTEFYRLNGATLYRVVEADDTMIKTEDVKGIGSVLGGGEISFAVMQQYPYEDMLAEGAKVAMGDLNRAPDFIGGFHGDEWMSAVSLTADGEVIDLQTSQKQVIPCSTVTFDLTGTMYAWGTSKPDPRGVPVAEHVQNFVLDSTGVTDVQTITWLRDDFVIHGAYMPMFTMMRGADGNRFIETMRAYDVDGNLLGEYVMDPEYIVETQTQILRYDNASSYEYTGEKGVSSTVSFKALREGIKFNSERIDLRPGVDNKLYVAVSSAVGGNAVPEGEVWEVELKFHIDYVVPEA